MCLKIMATLWIPSWLAQHSLKQTFMQEIVSLRHEDLCGLYVDSYEIEIP